MAKIHWTSAPTVSQAERDSNADVIKGLNLPLHGGSGPLAIVGGGPSIAEHLDGLRAWKGAIWAVNGAVNWCLDHGLDAWFYTCDAAALANWTYDLSRVKRAVLAPDVSPELVQYLLSNGAHVTIAAPVEHGPTSVNASSLLALHAGYHPIVYYGCEGSFGGHVDGETHAFKSHPVEDWLEIVVGGEHYRTKAEFITQSVNLAEVLREFPEHYSEQSGGLLRAMVEHGPEYDEYMVSNSLFAKLKDAA